MLWIHKNNLVAVAKTLQTFVTSQNNIYGGDITIVVNVMEYIVSINDRNFIKKAFEVNATVCFCDTWALSSAE